MTVQDALRLIDRVRSDDPLFEAAQRAQELLQSTALEHFEGNESDAAADAQSLCDIYEIRHTLLSSRGFLTYGFAESVAALRAVDRVQLYSITEDGWSILVATSTAHPPSLIGCLVAVKSRAAASD